MNIKNTFKKMVAILGIIGISIVSFAVPPKHPKPKPKITVVQSKKNDKQKANKKTNNKSSRKKKH